MRTIALLLFLFLPAESLAQEPLKVKAELLMEQTGKFAMEDISGSQKSFSLNERASKLLLSYSADREFEMIVSYPLPSAEGSENVVFNPLHSLRAKIPEGESMNVSIGLTSSPAWSAGRSDYYFTIRGEEGTVVSVHNLEMEPPSFTVTLQSYTRQFFLDEPVLISSVNFLWGYRIGDRSVVTMLGILFVLASVWFLRKEESGVRFVVLAALCAVLLYDARLSLDLLRTTSADLSKWYKEGEYRMTGPVHAVGKSLREERAQSVTVCTDGEDLLVKQLRYLLYPVPVSRAESNWNDASHGVLIDTMRGEIEGGVISCGEGRAREGEMLQEFPQRTRTVSFTDEPT